jgi:[protein-PII] uridylyltransferase
MVEPNVKEGKGGLRDSAHALLARAPAATDFTQPARLRRRRRVHHRGAQRFPPRGWSSLWTVRCHLHFITGRAEERLTFDLQPELAKRLGLWCSAPITRAVERFMKRYFLVAKEVGALTRVLCAQASRRTTPSNAPKGMQRFLSSRRAERANAG